MVPIRPLDIPPDLRNSLIRGEEVVSGRGTPCPSPAGVSASHLATATGSVDHASAVGSVILLTNADTFAHAIGVEGTPLGAAYIALLLVAAVSVTSAVLIHRRERAIEAAPAT